MVSLNYYVEHGDDELEFTATGPLARYLLEGGFANAEREPHWHLRWCLDRMEPGDTLDVGAARVTRAAPLP